MIEINGVDLSGYFVRNNESKTLNGGFICKSEDIGFLKGLGAMDETMLRKIESILAKGDRVELIPVKNGVKVLRIRRDEVKA